MTSPTHDGRVTTQMADGVATVSFYHPKGNSLPGAILARLAEEITALGANPAATVIVLRSEGDGPFCAGASFQELQALRTPEDSIASRVDEKVMSSVPNVRRVHVHYHPADEKQAGLSIGEILDISNRRNSPRPSEYYD